MLILNVSVVVFASVCVIVKYTCHMTALHFHGSIDAI